MSTKTEESTWSYIQLLRTRGRFRMALSKERIVIEALTLLNESSLEGVTLRKIAKRLDVYASALYWHFNNKEALVNEMAEVILREGFKHFQAIDENEAWQDWLIDFFNTLRQTLLAYSDGVKVVTSSQLSENMAKLSEMAIQTLYDNNVSLHTSRLTVVTAMRYTFGYVSEEQMEVSDKLLKEFDVDTFNQNHPLTAQAVQEYFNANKNIDTLFMDGLKLIIKE